jgi:formylglycine-generating enzyme required for sulfatase activity
LVILAALGGLVLATGQESQEPGGSTKSPPEELLVDLGGGVKLDLVLIPAGSFTMGSPDSDSSAFFDERPQHQVRITRPFYMAKYLVTQEQWEAVMGSNPSRFKGASNPVENVSWDQCRQFLEKLNAKSPPAGGKFQLPTEAQWEYACRAGSNRHYCFGDDPSLLDQYAWYAGNSGGATHAVGTKKPNAWGLYDMHGNLWEWCADWYDGGYYARSPADDPQGPREGTCRVIRGGGWSYDAGDCRSAFRGDFDIGGGWDFIGLRVCQVPADP